jgi:hypothetical protein
VRDELPEAEGETEGETEPEVVLGDICAYGNQDRLRLAKAIVQRISQREDFTYVSKAKISEAGSAGLVFRCRQSVASAGSTGLKARKRHSRLLERLEPDPRRAPGMASRSQLALPSAPAGG